MPNEKESANPQPAQPTSPQASQPSQAPAAPSQPPKKKSKGGKIFLSIALGCLVVILIGAILGYYVYKQVKKRAEEKLEGISFEELEKNLANLPSTAELEKIAEDMETSSTTSESESGEIGDKLSDGEVDIIINSFKKQDKVKDNTPMNDYEYVVINATLKNKSDKEISVFTSNFYLRDGNSNQYYEAYLTESPLDQPIAAWQYLAAGQNITGDMVFEAKKDVGDLVVVYEGKKKLEFKTGSN